MRSPMELVDERTIIRVAAEHWKLRIGELRYFPEGGGAYHWIAQDADDHPWFVTCDDLDTKPWLGLDRDSVFDGLLKAYGAAMDLRHDGMQFVAAPIATWDGDAAARVDERHSISVFEYVAGDPGRWGRPVGAGVRDELVRSLAALHRAAPAGRGIAHRGLDVPDRLELELALDELDGPWDGGPLSEPLRSSLAEHRDVVVGFLTDLDGLAAQLDGTSDSVVTHGEPHPGNLIHTDHGLVLVDWDTIALSRPERDLWMIADDERVASVYCELTGVTLDSEALTAYRLLWALSDLASFTVQLRAEHHESVDAKRALIALRSILEGEEPSPYVTPTHDIPPLH